MPHLVYRGDIVFDEFQDSGGNVYWLTQRWVGDGYLTLCTHSNLDGRVWDFPVFGDAERAWEGKIQAEGKNRVKFSILGKQIFYDPITHSAQDNEGVSFGVLEIPPNGMSFEPSLPYADENQLVSMVNGTSWNHYA